MKAKELLSRTGFLAESIDPTLDWDRSQWDQAEHFKALRWACEQATRLGSYTAREQDAVPLAQGESSITLADIPLQLNTVILMPLNKPLDSSTQDIENQVDPSWRSKAGIPFAWFPESGNVIRLNRKVPDSTYSVVLDVLEAPALLSVDTDDVDPRIPAHVQQGLHFAAAAYLLAQAGDYQDLKKAETYLTEFKRIIGGQA